MNEIQRRIAAQLWNDGKNTYEIAMAIFGVKLVMTSIYPPEYHDTEAIVCRNLRHIRKIAQRQRLQVPEGVMTGNA